MTQPINIQYYGLLDNAPQLFQPEFAEFMQWADRQQYLQFDVETDVTPAIRQRRLITVQFGSVNQPGQVQWVFQWSYLEDHERQYIKKLLEDHSKQKLIHNAQFELITCMNYGIRIRNIYDTMLMEHVLWCGYDGVHQVEADLQAVVWRRLDHFMDKSEQANFGDNIITSSKLMYAAQDVWPLDKIRNLQLLDLHRENLEYVAALENEAIIGIAQMTWEGMELDKEKWLENLNWAIPELQAAEDKLNKWLETQPFQRVAVREGFMFNEDRVLINYNSNAQKRKIVQLLWPDCPGATKANLKKYMTSVPDDQKELIYQLMEGNNSVVTDYLIKHHKDWLVDNEMLLLAGTSTLNWNSTEKVLKILQAVEPRLKSTGEEHLSRMSHPIAKHLLEYRERFKLTTTYGEDFFKYLHPDGKIHSELRPIVSTGRGASKNPNMQNITVKKFVGLRYRNSFKPPPGFKMVSGDYVSQELVVMAFTSGEAVWDKALREGKDVHSIMAELTYKDKWRKAAAPGCAYYRVQEKCKCPGHEPLRYDIKTVNFMIPYGASKYRLASELEIPVNEAARTLQDHEKAAPKVHRKLKQFGAFGVRNGYIMSLAPFFRKRFFPEWKYRERYVDEHLQGIRTDKVLGEIQRESMNMPIQGTSADVTKTAICMVMWELDEKNLHDSVKLLMQVHDQIDTAAREDFAEQWRPRLREIMEQAALLSIPNGLLRAEVNISDVWSK